MEEKKKLKKLVLKKEEIVNLNEYQMKSIQGGSGWYCETVSIGVELSIGVYNEGKEQSWWRCPNDGSNDFSKKIVQLPDGSRACEISEVYVYAYRP